MTPVYMFIYNEELARGYCKNNYTCFKPIYLKLGNAASWFSIATRQQKQAWVTKKKVDPTKMAKKGTLYTVLNTNIYVVDES